MPLPFKHKYIFKDKLTEKGIYFVNVKITYKGKAFFGKFVFCKKQIAYFENKIIGNIKQLSIKNNSNDIVFIDISVIKYLGDTTIK